MPWAPHRYSAPVSPAPQDPAGPDGARDSTSSGGSVGPAGAGAGDLIDGGSERVPRWHGRPAAVRRRWALGVVAVVGGAAVLLALRTTGPDDRPGLRPTVAAGPSAVGSAGIVAIPTAPYDRLPGRTPIPAPTTSGVRVAGALPPVGGPDEAAALRAAELVLGRACFDPAAYALTLKPEPDWRRVTAFVLTLDRSGDAPRITLSLRWTGRTYDWSGRRVELRVC